ncbi:hypothetical protein BU198_08420, partial [Streptomyces sp. CBMA156]|nr:hypothetical protein [Streptomyces sp. CBMA156]
MPRPVPAPASSIPGMPVEPGPTGPPTGGRGRCPVGRPVSSTRTADTEAADPDPPPPRCPAQSAITGAASTAASTPVVTTRRRTASPRPA